jgi:hypothetical protein
MTTETIKPVHTVMVVNDNPNNVQIIALLLREQKYLYYFNSIVPISPISS